MSSIILVDENNLNDFIVLQHVWITILPVDDWVHNILCWGREGCEECVDLLGNERHVVDNSSVII